MLLLSASVPCSLPFEVSLPVQGKVVLLLYSSVPHSALLAEVSLPVQSAVLLLLPASVPCSVLLVEVSLPVQGEVVLLLASTAVSIPWHSGGVACQLGLGMEPSCLVACVHQLAAG